jgi:hypothetical protein
LDVSSLVLISSKSGISLNSRFIFDVTVYLLGFIARKRTSQGVYGGLPEFGLQATSINRSRTCIRAIWDGATTR